MSLKETTEILGRIQKSIQEDKEISKKDVTELININKCLIKTIHSISVMIEEAEKEENK